jgi:protein TonB
MIMSATFRNRLHNSSALAITIALHAGIAAIAMLAITVAVPDRPPPPIVSRHIPETIKPVPTDVPPPQTEQRISTTVDLPDIVIDSPLPPIPDQPLVQSATGEPPIVDPVQTTVSPGPARAARFDPRFAAFRQPPYPAAARRLAEEGNVVVQVRIGRDGRVIAASLAQSSGSPRLDAAAIEHALKHWRFTPALADGAPIEATRTITVNFRLSDA